MIESFRGLNFCDLDLDILFHIFEFCSLNDLVALKCVNHYLNCIISESYLIQRKSKLVLMCNQSSKIVKERSFILLSPAEKCRVSKNWANGCYKEIVFRLRKKYMPWLMLQKNTLWVSHGNNIRAYKRKKNTIDFKNPSVSISIEATADADVSRFDLDSDMLVCGDRDNGIWGFDPTSGKHLFTKHYAHSSDVSSVALYNNLILSASKDGIAKVWRLTASKTDCVEVLTKCLSNRIWCMAVNPNSQLVCCGVVSSSSTPLSISIFDLNSSADKFTSPGKMDCHSVVLDVLWETPQTIITCGSSSCVKLYDLRCDQVVLNWNDPFNTVGYCLASDHANSVLCGVAMHSRIQLFDKRTRNCVQSFSCNQKMSSPVYSMNFDATQLFSVLDSSISIMNFGGFNNICRNYNQFYDYIQIDLCKDELVSS